MPPRREGVRERPRALGPDDRAAHVELAEPSVVRPRAVAPEPRTKRVGEVLHAAVAQTRAGEVQNLQVRGERPAERMIAVAPKKFIETRVVVFAAGPAA